ncbi:MAG: alpha/beta hydrolase [Myxococcales bacterium]|nr:alpha/beta hydrolase [Myxococcales bacterium]
MDRLWMLLRAVLLAVGVVYVLFGTLLWALQERMLFVPPGVGRDQLDAAAAEIGAEPLDVVASDGVRTYAWLRRASPDNHRLVLHFPGNAETVADNLALQRLLLTHGWDVLIGGYRGYPGSDGSPSERGLARDAEAAWAWATGPGGYEPRHIVVHGRSLGGGVASHLVAGPANPAALVLESTFSSVREVAQHGLARFYPVGLLLRHPFDSRERAPSLGVPVFLVHAIADQVVPIDLGARQLRPVIAEVEYHEVGDGFGHNDPLVVVDPAVRDAYLAFLERFGGN